MSIIKVEHLGKKYTIGRRRSTGGFGHQSTFREAVSRTAQRHYQRLRHPMSSKSRQASREEFWALQDVGFEIERGDRVGIIGRNGAGKSTLLKILSRITEPTTGRIEIDGRVASLLEVGTGFHPELTGRENIFLNGAILGMSRVEIRQRFDEIIAFAEIERFLDTPVKRYSSGMYVRLAFSVAAHLEPEILIVDEVLAVGDAQFQKKCLGKMQQVGDEGRTVLFVSHNMVAVRALCSRAIILKDGRISHDGRAEDSISLYMESSTDETTFERSWHSTKKAPGNEKIRLRRIGLVAADGTIPEDVSIRDSVNIEIEYWNQKPDARLSISMHVVTEEDIVAFATTTWEESEWNGRQFPKGLFKSTCFIPGDLLNVGPYKICLYFLEDSTNVVCRIDHALTFKLLDSCFGRGEWHGKWDGATRPRLKWSTEQSSGPAPHSTEGEFEK